MLRVAAGTAPALRQQPAVEGEYAASQQHWVAGVPGCVVAGRLAEPGAAGSGYAGMSPSFRANSRRVLAPLSPDGQSKRDDW